MRFLLFIRVRDSKHTFRNAAGFTLIELLLVITLLAVLAVAAISAFDGTEDEARFDVTQHQLAQLRDALLQFRRDSGSNHFPKQGVYDCDDDPNVDSDTPNPKLEFPSWLDSLTAQQKVDWCRHPANFWMLVEYPFADDENRWSADRKRGWNGPYIRKTDYLELGNDNRLGLPITQAPLRAIADPYDYRHFDEDPEKHSQLYWYSGVADLVEIKKYGSPYILLDIDNDDSVRLVSFGENTLDDGGNPPPDICKPKLDSRNVPLDHVLCLLR